MTPQRPKGGKSPAATPFPWSSDAATEQKIAQNLLPIVAEVISRGRAGDVPTEQDVRLWFNKSLTGVRVAELWVPDTMRGQGPLHSQTYNCEVRVGAVYGTPPRKVGPRVRAFFADLKLRTAALDAKKPAEADVVAVHDRWYDDAVELCAWTHGEWVRIHPFVNNNGSTARLLTMFIGARYGILLRLPGKPRTNAPAYRGAQGLVLTYDLAAEQHMQGKDQLMVEYLHAVAAAPTP